MDADVQHLPPELEIYYIRIDRSRGVCVYGLPKAD